MLGTSQWCRNLGSGELDVARLNAKQITKCTKKFDHSPIRVKGHMYMLVLANNMTVQEGG